MLYCCDCERTVPAFALQSPLFSQRCLNPWKFWLWSPVSLLERLKHRIYMTLQQPQEFVYLIVDELCSMGRWLPNHIRIYCNNPFVSSHPSHVVFGNVTKKVWRGSLLAILARGWGHCWSTVVLWNFLPGNSVALITTRFVPAVSLQLFSAVEEWHKFCSPRYQPLLADCTSVTSLT